MYLIPEDGQYDQNLYHVLTGLIKFVVFSGICLSIFNMYRNIKLYKNVVLFWSKWKLIIHFWMAIYSFIPLACAEWDDSLSFSGAPSIPLCYVLFPATLLHQLFFHPLSPHLSIYFLVYLSILLFPNLYIILFWELYFLHSLYMPKPA